MGNEHRYETGLRWTGNRGTGTSGYRAYGRDHVITVAGKVDLAGSSDVAFRGDAERHNPEELLVAALSACHLLAYLHLCVEAGIVVSAYEDRATGVMVTDGAGAGRFREVTLHPAVTITAGDAAVAQGLHARAHELCFIASSVNFEVRCEATVREVGA